jgi:hypothetical protein
MLVEITGSTFDRAVNILRKHDGDMAKVADALLNNAADNDVEERERQLQRGFRTPLPAPEPEGTRVDFNVIDFTGQD